MNKKQLSWVGVFGLIATINSGSALAEHWGEKNKLQDFVSRKDVLTNIREIESRGLNSHELKIRPWSSSYWPDNVGSVAWRYAETGSDGLSHKKNMLLGWDHNRPDILEDKTFMEKPIKVGNETVYPHKDVTKLSEEDLNKLSPAEKYDVLMGDKNFTLWNATIKRLNQLEKLDLMALWSGICHGWAPATLVLPRPAHGVVMKTPSGRDLKFYPDDIKALIALLWGSAFGNSANAQNFAKSEGWQCQTGAKKNGNGRLVDPRCADVNAGFFHLVTVNQIGLNQRGYIMDKDHRAGVWNQPTYRYEFKYYKLSDRKPKMGVSLAEAKVAIPSKYWDPYSNYRSRKAVTLVGVEGKFWYGHETSPSHKKWTDSVADDNTKTLTIRYDLELDAKDEIVGGEWREYENNDSPTLAEQYRYQHPDLLWLFPPGIKALSVGDFAQTSAWDGNGPVPKDWLEASIKAAQKNYPDRVRGKDVIRLAPQPMAKVIDVLIDKSRR